MMVRRAVLEAVGAFDESFFMYGEDLDYCHRVRLAGGKVYYHPKAVVVHHGGVSSATNRQRAEREFYRAMWLFYRKHYAPAAHPLTNKMVYLGIAGLDRLARVGSLVHLKRRPTAV
jgi:GT2 family glycosyltransferase